jgi:UDP-N-acetylmuramoyl-tripeptide--D-alanyl-D-alanine ligase
MNPGIDMQEKVKLLYSKFLVCHQVTTDSRAVQQNDLFFALKGPRFDGNRFAMDAIKLGASYVVVNDPKAVVDERIILVEDTLKMLQELARYHREKLQIPVIGITGTNGKTTTKELIGEVLRKKYSIAITQGNLNNHIGVPLTILSIKPEHEIAVIEMGANHPGEIADLCQICQPTTGIVTNVGKAHLEGFGSLEGVIKTKKELFDFLLTNNANIVINGDDSQLRVMAGKLPRTTYGLKPENDLIAFDVMEKPALHFYWRHKMEPKKNEVKSRLIGQYNIYNMMAAITFGEIFKVPAADINKALSAYRPKNNRSQQIKTSHNDILLDAYNANPTSMKLALESFLALKHQPKLAIIGEMLELGPDSSVEHQKLLKYIDQKNQPELIFLVGQAFKNKTKQTNRIRYFETTSEVVKYLQQHPVKGFLIFLKGSRKNQLEKLVEYL